MLFLRRWSLISIVFLSVTGYNYEVDSFRAVLDIPKTSFESSVDRIFFDSCRFFAFKFVAEKSYF